MFDPFNMFDPFGAGRRRTPTLASLFGPSDVGILFEPQVRNTMWQDAAGVTPVSTYGQGFLRWGDRSGGGRNATQASAASALIYGRHPVGGTRNLLVPVPTEDFSNASWLRTGISPFGSGSVANSAVAPDGTMSADFICEDTTTGFHYVRCTGTAIGQSATFSAYVKAAGRTYAYLYSSANTSSGLDCRVNLSTGVVTNNAVGTTVTTEDFGGGWWRVKMAMTGVHSGAVGFFAVVGPVSGAGAGIPSYLGDGVSGILVWGAQVEVGSSATAYQTVTNAYDVTETGKADCYYALCDGADNSLATAAFAWGSDEVTIIAALYGQDNNTTIIAEFSPTTDTNNGSFAAITGSGGVRMRSKGTVIADYTGTGLVIPQAYVFTGQGKISGNISSVRLNGVMKGNTNGSQGTGNFGTYGFNIGRRNNATLPLNAKIYSLFAINRILNADELALAERLMAAKYGGTL